MLNRRELQAAFTGIRYLLRFRPEGFLFFDPTRRGCLNSFWAALILLPFWGLMLAYQLPPDKITDWWQFAGVQGAAYVVGWLSYPLLMIPVVVLFHRTERYCLYIATYNWFQLVQLVLWPPLLLLTSLGAPQEVLMALWVLLHIVFLAYSFFIARIGLAVESITATALVIIDFLLGVLIDAGADSLSGIGLGS